MDIRMKLERCDLCSRMTVEDDISDYYNAEYGYTEYLCGECYKALTKQFTFTKVKQNGRRWEQLKEMQSGYDE